MKKDAVIDGAIITLSSTAAVQTGMAPVAFTASQHAVIGLTQQAAAELAPAGIRVNCVSPTVLDTVTHNSCQDSQSSNNIKTSAVAPAITVQGKVANICTYVHDSSDDTLDVSAMRPWHASLHG